LWSRSRLRCCSVPVRAGSVKMLHTQGIVGNNNEWIVARQHKPNSIDHLAPTPPMRPALYRSRPASAPVRSQPGQRKKRPQTASCLPNVRSSADRNPLQKAIHGDTGPAMIGVTNFAFSPQQKMYIDDFEQVTAGSLTHPFCSITSFNVGSAPHNLLTGSAFADTGTAKALDRLRSEYARSYLRKSYVQAFNQKANGLRSEEFAFVG